MRAELIDKAFYFVCSINGGLEPWDIETGGIKTEALNFFEVEDWKLAIHTMKIRGGYGQW